MSTTPQARGGRAGALAERLRGTVGRARRLGDLVSSSSYRRALWCRTLCRALARTNPDLRLVGITRGKETTLLLLRDSVITPYTLTSDGFQRDELDRVLRWCRKIGSPLGGVFVDVGANMGTTTLMALRTGQFSDAICIEPGPENVELIAMNMAVNGLGERVRVVAAAVSGENTTSRLYLAEENSGDHQIGPSSDGSAGRRTAIEVETKTLDAVLAAVRESPARVSCVWVDTQGCEGLVLRGAPDLIAAGTPFCIEFWPHGCRRVGCYEELLHTVETRFAGFVDLGEPDPAPVRHPSTIRDFARRFDGSTEHTDLFLIPSGKGI